MTGRWELLGSRPGGTVTSLVTIGSVVLAATPAGVRRSTDDGRGWSVLGGAVAPSPEVVAASPAFTADALLLAGTADGLLRSPDAGQTWQTALVGSRVLSIAFSPDFHRDGLVLVGTEQDGVLRSTDRGRTWTSGNPGLLDLTVLGLACSPAFEADHTVFAATSSGLFRSPNGGRTWRAIESVPGEPAVQSLVLSPRWASEPVILAGTEANGLLRSADGGATWYWVDACAGRSVTALAWSSDSALAAGTDAGVMTSDDGGVTWSHTGRELGPVLSVAFAPDGALLAGMPRTGVARSRDFVRLEAANDGLQANLVVSIALSPEFEQDHTLYLAGLEDGVSVSTDGGATWESANSGLGTTTAVLGLAASPAGLYAATSAGVFRKRDFTDEWKRVYPDPARAVRADAQRVVALGMQGALMASSDGGASWRPLEWPASAGQAKSVAQLLVPLTLGDDGPIFAGLGDTVVRGTQRARLPGPVTSLDASPAYRADKTVLAGTTAGACISHDAGLTFQPLGAGLGNVPVVAVAFSPAYATDHLVYAVELGGRIWRHHY